MKTSFFYTRIARPLAPRKLAVAAVIWAVCLGAISLVVLWLHHHLLDDRDMTLRSAAMVTYISGGPLMAMYLAVAGHLIRLEEGMSQLAATDMLTGLRNRRAFLRDAGDCHGKSAHGLVLILDADHFKRINDQFGHAVGDEFLRALAQNLQGQIRACDIVGRIGGEEFGIYMPGATVEDATAIANRLCQGVELCPEQHRHVQMTASIGGAETTASEALETAMNRADQALYTAKSTGRARPVFCPPGPVAHPQAAPMDKARQDVTDHSASQSTPELT